MLSLDDRETDICEFFFFSSRRRHTRWTGDWSSDVCSSDLTGQHVSDRIVHGPPVPSPARLRDARDEPLQRQVPETDAAHLDAPQDSARTAAAPAPVAVPDGVPLFLPH